MLLLNKKLPGALLQVISMIISHPENCLNQVSTSNKNTHNHPHVNIYITPGLVTERQQSSPVYTPWPDLTSAQEGNVNYSADMFSLARPFSLRVFSIYRAEQHNKKSHTAAGIQSQKWKSKAPQNPWQKTKWSYWKIDMKIWPNISSSRVSHICFSRHADTESELHFPLGSHLAQLDVHLCCESWA